MDQPAEALSNPHTWLWIIWLLQAFAIEGQALMRKKKGDTLTEHLVHWASLKDKGKWWRWRRVGLMSFLVWLTVHLATAGEWI